MILGLSSAFGGMAVGLRKLSSLTVIGLHDAGTQIDFMTHSGTYYSNWPLV